MRLRTEMIKETMTQREKQFQIVYRTHADDVYKFCFYYMRDEEKASEITQQAFLNFYKYFDKVIPDYRLGYLVREVKELLAEGQNLKSMCKEVRKCARIGKK